MKFQVGDVCIVIASATPEVPVGTEVTILAIGNCPHDWRGRDGSKLWPYQITSDVWIMEWGLKKKEPPEIMREELGSWDLCPWQPKKVQHA